MSVNLEELVIAETPESIFSEEDKAFLAQELNLPDAVQPVDNAPLTYMELTTNYTSDHVTTPEHRKYIDSSNRLTERYGITLHDLYRSTQVDDYSLTFAGKEAFIDVPSYDEQEKADRAIVRRAFTNVSGVGEGSQDGVEQAANILGAIILDPLGWASGGVIGRGAFFLAGATKAAVAHTAAATALRESSKKAGMLLGETATKIKPRISGKTGAAVKRTKSEAGKEGWKLRRAKQEVEKSNTYLAQAAQRVQAAELQAVNKTRNATILAGVTEGGLLAGSEEALRQKITANLENKDFFDEVDIKSIALMSTFGAGIGGTLGAGISYLLNRLAPDLAGKDGISKKEMQELLTAPNEKIQAALITRKLYTNKNPSNRPPDPEAEKLRAELISQVINKANKEGVTLSADGKSFVGADGKDWNPELVLKTVTTQSKAARKAAEEELAEGVKPAAESAANKAAEEGTKAAEEGTPEGTTGAGAKAGKSKGKAEGKGKAEDDVYVPEAEGTKTVVSFWDSILGIKITLTDETPSTFTKTSTDPDIKRGTWVSRQMYNAVQAVMQTDWTRSVGISRETIMRRLKDSSVIMRGKAFTRIKKREESELLEIIKKLPEDFTDGSPEAIVKLRAALAEGHPSVAVLEKYRIKKLTNARNRGAITGEEFIELSKNKTWVHREWDFDKLATKQGASRFVKTLEKIKNETHQKDLLSILGVDNPEAILRALAGKGEGIQLAIQKAAASKRKGHIGSEDFSVGGVAILKDRNILKGVPDAVENLLDEFQLPLLQRLQKAYEEINVKSTIEDVYGKQVKHIKVDGRAIAIPSRVSASIKKLLAENEKRIGKLGKTEADDVLDPLSPALVEREVLEFFLETTDDSRSLASVASRGATGQATNTALSFMNLQLILAAIPNASQQIVFSTILGAKVDPSFFGAARAFKNAVQGEVKGIGYLLRQNKSTFKRAGLSPEINAEDAALIIKSGVLSQTISAATGLSEGTSSRIFGKGSTSSLLKPLDRLGLDPSKFLEATGFQGIERVNRVSAAFVGANTLTHNWVKYYKLSEAIDVIKKKGGSVKNEMPKLEKIAKELKLLGIADPKHKLLKEGRELTLDDLGTAGFEWNRAVNFTDKEASLPSAWRGTNTGRLLSKFQSFAFHSGAFMKHHVYGEARDGNFQPLIAVLTVGAGGGLTVIEARDLVKELLGADVKEREENLSLFGLILEGVGAIAAFGVFTNIYVESVTREYHKPPVEKIAGVAGSSLNRVAGAVVALTEGDVSKVLPAMYGSAAKGWGTWLADLFNPDN